MVDLVVVDLDLVVVTVGHPTPYLLFGQLTLVHGPMVGMVNMIELALGPQLGLELVPAQRLCATVASHCQAPAAQPQTLYGFPV